MAIHATSFPHERSFGGIRTQHNQEMWANLELGTGLEWFARKSTPKLCYGMPGYGTSSFFIGQLISNRAIVRIEQEQEGIVLKRAAQSVSTFETIPPQ